MPMLSGLRGRRDDKLKKAAKDKAAAAAVSEAPSPLPDEYAPPTREVVRPANQLPLNEAELREEVAKMLTANNPAAPQNLARFNMKERSYKFEPMVEQHVVHYASDGWLLHKSSEDARKQMEQEKAEAEAAARFQSEMDRALKEKAAGLDVDLPDDSRQLRNQFNFSERAAQTFTYPMRDRATFTEPAPKATISGSCSMREIFDEYCRDFERQRQEEASKQRPGAKKVASTTNGQAADQALAAVGGAAAADAASSSSSSGGVARPDQASSDKQWAALEALLDKVRIVDRMVNQNTFADVAMDFKYWDDTSDALRPGEGSLLPLWQFVCEQGRKHVTSMCWSSMYADQFAVGYGSFHYQRQGTGAISIFSLKNPSHAEVTLTTESGVMALQFHPEYANLLAVGCYDGSVSVYDVRQKTNKPLYSASAKAKKHSDTVWQVCWQVDELQRGLSFVSISADGDVLLWTLAKCELLPERLIRLQPSTSAAHGAAAAAAGGPAAGAGAAASSAVAAASELLPQQQADGGLCMDFSKFPGREHVYLVGSESGSVHQCSTAYGSDYLASFNGHCMPVYAVKWNGMHPDLFLSCSADWSIKVWDITQQQAPVLSFDVGAAVGDVAWAPSSSTVFAAVTDEGKVHVFDLAQNRQLPLCAQKCAKKARLTRVAFNPHFPILLVGDSKGNVSALKLSPNLRKPAGKDEKTGAKLEEAERQKLERVIAVAKSSQAPVLAAS